MIFTLRIAYSHMDIWTYEFWQNYLKFLKMIHSFIQQIFNEIYYVSNIIPNVLYVSEQNR